MEALTVTLETAKKLKAAGFHQSTLFHHVITPEHKGLEGQVYGERSYITSYDLSIKNDDEDYIAAPTAQELANQLPSLAGRDDKFQLQITKATNEYQAWYSPIDDSTSLSHLYFEQADTVAEALALLWLKLQEDK